MEHSRHGLNCHHSNNEVQNIIDPLISPVQASDPLLFLSVNASVKYAKGRVFNTKRVEGTCTIVALCDCV